MRRRLYVAVRLERTVAYNRVVTLARLAGTTTILTWMLTATTLTRVTPDPVAAAAQSAGDLPDGDGKKILQASCTACHDLTEVTKFKGYYTRDEWRDVVKTMIEYGAAVKPDDVDVLVEYLAKNLGKK
jgi:cytochrome c5